MLSPITLATLAGTLTDLDFCRMLGARKGFQRCQRATFKPALARGRSDLARRLARHVLTRSDNRCVRPALNELKP